MTKFCHGVFSSGARFPLHRTMKLRFPHIKGSPAGQKPAQCNILISRWGLRRESACLCDVLGCGRLESRHHRRTIVGRALESTIEAKKVGRVYWRLVPSLVVLMGLISVGRVN